MSSAAMRLPLTVSRGLNYDVTHKKMKVEHKATAGSYTVYVGDSGTLFTNLGGGITSFALPANARKGMWLRFKILVAAAFSIVAPTNGAIYFKDGAAAYGKGSDNQTISNSTIGGEIHLVADGNGDWIATYTKGTWT